MGILSGVRDAVGGATDFLGDTADAIGEKNEQVQEAATEAAEDVGEGIVGGTQDAVDTVASAGEDAADSVGGAFMDVATDEELQEQFDASEGVTDLGNLDAGFKATAELALDKTGIQDGLKAVAKAPTEIATGEKVTDEELANATADVYGDAAKGANAVSDAIGENVGPNTEAVVDFLGEAFVADPIEGTVTGTTGINPATGEDDAYLSAAKAVDPLIFAGTGTLKAGKVGAKGAAKLSETGATNMGFVSGATKLTDEVFGLADDTADEGVDAVDDAVDIGSSGTSTTDNAFGSVDVTDDVGGGFDDVDAGDDALDFAADAGRGGDEFGGNSFDVGGFGDVFDSGASTFDDVGGSFDDTANTFDDFSSTVDETATGADETVQGADDAASGADETVEGADDAATGADDGFSIGTGTKVFGGIGAGALGTAGAIDFLGGGLADNDDDSPDPDNPTRNGAGEDGWGEPQQVDEGRGWTVYAQRHSDGRTRFYAVRDDGSTYLQPEGETGSEPHYFSSEQALTEAFKAWARKQQSGDGGGSSGEDGGAGGSGSGSGSDEGGWSEPKQIETVQGWYIYGQTHPSKGERYFAAGKRDDGGKIYLQPEGETSTSIHYFDSAEAVRSALEAWAQRRDEGETSEDEEPSGGQPKNPTEDRGGWSEMKHVRELPLGWHLYGQSHPDEGERYVVTGTTNGTTIYLAEDGTVVEEPVYYTSTDGIRAALEAYAKRVENGEAERRPSGDKPGAENVTEDADESGGGVGGALSSLSTKQKLVGGALVAVGGYYAYEEGYFDDLGGEA